MDNTAFCKFYNSGDERICQCGYIIPASGSINEAMKATIESTKETPNCQLKLERAKKIIQAKEEIMNGSDVIEVVGKYNISVSELKASWVSRYIDS